MLSHDEKLKNLIDSIVTAEEGAGAIQQTTTDPLNKQKVIKEHRGNRKTSKITIESFPNKNTEDTEYPGILPTNSRETTPLEDKKVMGDSLEEINFFSGNPFVEVTKGIIHLYKNNERTEIVNGPSKSLCLLAVPATLSCHDIINFVAPCHAVIQYIRIIRDASPNQFMVLLEFRSVESATEFYRTYNGAPYSTFDNDSLCHALWVSAVDWGNDGVPPLGHTELPLCPVCLERMDESVDGVLTILCNHAFHAGCLVKWGDSTCPVCRCVQTPELTENSVCMECEGTEALWICLICGHIGCGRYQGGHAALHYRSTNHAFAMQLGTNRVWDYAGDNFVHRLLQSKEDCKLVATQSPGNVEDEKVDSIQLEYTYLLTSQLDAQREFYEEKLTRLESTIMSEMDLLKVQTTEIKEHSSTLDSKITSLTKEKQNLEKKNSQLTAKLSSAQKELVEERQMSKAIQANQSTWQSRYTALEKKFDGFKVEKEKEIGDLKDEVRDLMFYMEAQNAIANSDLKDEIQSTSMTVHENQKEEKTRRRSKKGAN